MSELIFEWGKLKNRKWPVWLFIANALLLIIGLRVLSMLDYAEGNYSEGQFMERVAYGIISFSTLYLFIPLWILVFTGIEFINGHVQQVVFCKSHSYYFKLKLYFCLLIAIYYTLISFGAYFFIYFTVPFNPVISTGFTVSFIVQAFVTFLATALFLQCLVMLTRNAPLAFGIFYGWSLLESLIFRAVSRLYGVDLIFMPYHVLNLFYSRNGEKDLEFYYNPIIDFNYTALLLPMFIILVLYITYRDFTHRELKPLSD